MSSQRVRILEGADVPDSQRAGGRPRAQDQAVGVEGAAGVPCRRVRAPLRVLGALQKGALAQHIQEVPAIGAHRHHVFACMYARCVS